MPPKLVTSTGSPLAKPAFVRAANLERDPLKKDFKNFQWKMWMTLFGNPPTGLMYEMGDRLQFGPDRDILMGFRGMSKSYTTVGYCAFLLNRNREEQILTVSGSGTGAKGNADLAYAMITGFDWLAHLKPQHGQRQSAQAFDVAGAKPKKSESFASESLFGQITGRRASTIVPDDVETPNTSSTETDRAELRRRYAELGGAILIPGGAIKVLGTSQTEQTLYLELVLERGYGMCMWPATYPLIHEDPKKDELHKYQTWLAPSIRDAIVTNPELAGLPTEPTRFDLNELFIRQQEYGVTEYERQFRLFLDAGVAADKPLKLKDLIVIEIPRPTPGNPLRVPDDLHWSPSPVLKWDDITTDALTGDSSVYAPARMGVWHVPEITRMVIDPSGSGTDETAWGVLAEDLGRVYLVHKEQRLEGFSQATMEAIAADAKLYGVSLIKIEKNFGGGMFGELLRPYLLAIGHPCSIEEENAGQTQKEVRIIDTLEPILTGHRLVVSAQVLRDDFKVPYTTVEEAKKRFYRLTYQLTRITKKRGAIAHDDRVDMLASGVASFVGTLRRQLADALAQSKEAYIQEQGEKIVASLAKLAAGKASGSNPHGRLGEFLKGAQQGLASSPFFRGRRPGR